MESEPRLPAGLPHRETASQQQSTAGAPSPRPRLLLRTISELCEALPYLLGFHPDDSVVLLRVEGEQLAGSLRADLPPDGDDLRLFAGEFAAVLPEPQAGTVRPSPPGAAPEVVVVLCSDARTGEDGPADVRWRLSALAQELAVACSRRGMAVVEVLGLSGGRCWSFRCVDAQCCPADGNPVAVSGTSAVEAAAVYGGLPQPTSRRQWEQRFAPMRSGVAGQQDALRAARAVPLPDGAPPPDDVVDPKVVRLALRVLRRFVASPPSLPAPQLADAEDDALLSAEEAAQLIVGVQNEALRRRAADWVGGRITHAAIRLWSALARRCVEPFAPLAVPLLALAAWTSWLAGDLTRTRIACGLALREDPSYPFARLIHQACNSDLDAASFLSDSADSEPALVEEVNDDEKPPS